MEEGLTPKPDSATTNLIQTVSSVLLGNLAKGQSSVAFTLVPENSEPKQLLSVLWLVDGLCPLTKLRSGYPANHLSWQLAL